MANMKQFFRIKEASNKRERGGKCVIFNVKYDSIMVHQILNQISFSLLHMMTRQSIYFTGFDFNQGKLMFSPTVF